MASVQKYPNSENRYLRRCYRYDPKGPLPFSCDRSNYLELGGREGGKEERRKERRRERGEGKEGKRGKEREGEGRRGKGEDGEVKKYQARCMGVTPIKSAASRRIPSKDSSNVKASRFPERMAWCNGKVPFMSSSWNTETVPAVSNPLSLSTLPWNEKMWPWFAPVKD
jgi:hypothetical protein